MTQLDHMKKLLDEAFLEDWGPRGALKSELADLSEHQEHGYASGTLRIHLRTNSGAESVVLEQAFEALEDAAAVDDFIADTLSRLLASHGSWPR